MQQEYDRVERKYKVIRISYVWAESRKDAMKAVQEDILGKNIAVMFAVEDITPGFWAQLVKQITG